MGRILAIFAIGACLGGCLGDGGPALWVASAGASFYHEGKWNADGSRFYADGETCAHRFLPFGTMLLITDLDNGLSATCEIRDRGPARWTGKDFDLSRGVARKLDLLDRGVTRVRVEIIETPDYPMGMGRTTANAEQTDHKAYSAR